ncbi:MAG TPA: hypothetical protein VKQ06_09695, partial [Gammaproteobacteria bacterium]|nr:hypothetical protein [Gammaproteobacteria bacterium]
MATRIIPIHRDYDLPWSADYEQEDRFRTLVRRCAVAVLGVALLLSFLPTPQSDPQQVREIPPRLARLMLEQVAPPPPPVVVPEPEPEPIPEEPEVVAEAPPE